MGRALFDYFRCPDEAVPIEIAGQLSEQAGFFTFGKDTICYGQCVDGSPAIRLEQDIPDVVRGVRVEGERPLLRFDFSQVVDNLRNERYSVASRGSVEGLIGGGVARRIYYLLRPLLPVPVRKRLQKIQLSGWRNIVFPRWPVDVTVETLMQNALACALKAGKTDRIPFIWFWPDGAPSCAIMTHDVESATGLAFCNNLMDMDDAFEIKSSFQVVPELRYEVGEDVLAKFRRRGFEVNVHDLNHDGYLFYERKEFLRRAAHINRYATQFQSCGFRSGAMYRNQNWYDAFDFRYDMSVPNVAHFEPQRGGCCTVMPYFIGKILELPLTTIQDYSLFHILGDYSINLWKQQIEIVLEKNGLASFNTHPDYLTEPHARSVYTDLLAHLFRLRAAGKLWIALPADVDRWWRNRHHMRLIRDGKRWRIDGPDSHRARIAYASLERDRVVYTMSSRIVTD
jgi:hypothetical protein